VKNQSESKFKNWKSTVAFMIFVGAYVYSIYAGKSDSVVDTSGYVALLSSLFMMFRSQVTSDMLSTLIENVSKK